jgi:hypothetical protein
MRRTLWMIPAVLLFTALASTPARADSVACGTATCIYTVSGDVTEIEGLSLGGTTYNVTFGTTEDMTFATNLTNADLMNLLINDALNGGPGKFALAGDACVVGVDGGTLVYLTYGESSTCEFPGAGFVWGVDLTTPTSYAAEVSNVFQGELWAEFTPVTQSTPEPSTAILILLGLGSFGLMSVLRKRISLGLLRVS